MLQQDRSPKLEWKSAFQLAIQAEQFEILHVSPGLTKIRFFSEESALGAIQCFWFETGSDVLSFGELNDKNLLKETLSDRLRGDRASYIQEQGSAVCSFRHNNDSESMSIEAREWIVSKGFGSTVELKLSDQDIR